MDFRYHILGLTIDGYRLDHPRFKKKKGVLGRGLYAVLQAELSGPLPLCWVLKRPWLLRSHPKAEDVKLWRRIHDVKIGAMGEIYAVQRDESKPKPQTRRRHQRRP